MRIYLKILMKDHCHSSGKYGFSFDFTGVITDDVSFELDSGIKVWQLFRNASALNNINIHIEEIGNIYEYAEILQKYYYHSYDRWNSRLDTIATNKLGWGHITAINDLTTIEIKYYVNKNNIEGKRFIDTALLLSDTIINKKQNHFGENAYLIIDTESWGLAAEGANTDLPSANEFLMSPISYIPIWIDDCSLTISSK